MNVRRVAGEEDPVHAVGRRLTRHVGEPGDPRSVVDPEIGAVHGDERLAQIAQGGLAARPELLLGHDDPYRPPVLQPVEGVDARGVVADAPRRFLGHLDLGDQVAPGGIPPRELDPGARRMTLRPPSHPTRYCARSDWPSDSSTSTPVSSWAKPVTSHP